MIFTLSESRAVPRHSGRRPGLRRANLEQHLVALAAFSPSPISAVRIEVAAWAASVGPETQSGTEAPLVL